MSADARAKAARLREKFAKVFDVPIGDVLIDEPEPDCCRVHCPSHPELPQWGTGAWFGHDTKEAK